MYDWILIVSLKDEYQLFWENIKTFKFLKEPKGTNIRKAGVGSMSIFMNIGGYVIPAEDLYEMPSIMFLAFMATRRLLISFFELGLGWIRVHVF